MEDAATAEISRTQVWQWLKEEVTLSNGKTFNEELYEKCFYDELRSLEFGDQMNPAWKSNLADAAKLFNKLVRAKELKDFLTLEAYELIK